MEVAVTGGLDDPYGGWHVVSGEELGATCIVAGKRSIFKSITRLEWHLASGGTYKARNKARTENHGVVAGLGGRTRVLAAVCGLR